MADTIRTLAYLIASEFQNGQPPGSISPQDMRDFLVSVAAGTVSTSRTLTTGTTFLSTDRYIFSNQSAAIAYTLYASPVTNQMITVKDIAGNAATYNITITGTIDGASSFVLNNNYAFVDLIYNGTNWSVI